MLDTGRKKIKLFSNAIAALIPFLFFSLSYLMPTQQKDFMNGGIASLVMTVIYFVFQKRQWAKRFYATLFFFPAIFFFKKDLWWLALLLIVLFILYTIATSEKKIMFDPTQIKLDPPFGKTFKWFELQNAILKDGLLTLDFKNNKLLQTIILDDLNELETKQFNDFCSERLKAQG